MKIESKSTTLRVPALFGGLNGDKEKLHATVRAGVSTHFLIRTKINDEIQDSSETNRFGWNGVLRGTFGFNLLDLVVETIFYFNRVLKGCGCSV